MVQALSNSTTPFIFRLLVFILGVFSFVIAQAQERGPVYFSVDVEPDKWQALEIKNLPSQVKLTINVTTEGSITATVIGSEDLKRFPRIENPLFIGAVTEALNFSVTTTKADNYYVVLHNISTRTSRSVSLVVRAERVEQKKPAETNSTSPNII